MHGYEACKNEIEDTILDNPIVYEPFTSYFDTKKLDDIKAKYGKDLFETCKADVELKVVSQNQEDMDLEEDSGR